MLKNINQNETTGDLTVTYKNDNEILNINLIRVNISDDMFLKIKETLQRIGIYSPKTKTLWQSAHILHKKGFYYIVHFKELFALDGRSTNIEEDDILRRDTIIGLLLKWALITLPNKEDEKEYLELVNDEFDFPVRLRVISYKNKRDFNLKSKYPIGQVK